MSDNASNDILTHEERLEQKVMRLERMVYISRQLSSTLNLDDLLELIIETAAELLQAEAASILLEEKRTGELYFAAATGSSSEELRQVEVPMDSSIAGKIYRTGDPLIVEDVASDPSHFGGVDERIRFQTRSILGVPLQVRGQTIGVLEALNKCDGTPFNDDDVEILQTLASQVAVAIQNATLVTELRAAYKRLSELDKIKTDFISIASHELRTPLTLVLGYANFLQDQASDELKAQAAGVLRNATRLQGIIEAMTNLSYLESGEMQVQAETFILQELIEDVCADWRAVASAKRQVLNVKMGTTPLHVELDRAKVGIVLTNLLNNAVKFTPEGGKIEVAVRPQTGKVAVSVTDTGVGIPAEQLDRIFEGFYQVEEHMTRRHEGVGLGLTIAKGMVELQGGRIWVESVPGRGSRFTFLLPIRWVQAVRDVI